MTENIPTNIVDLTPENFQEVLGASTQGKVVVVCFWTVWDEPSKPVVTALETLAGEQADILLLARVNCDEQQQIAMQFQVRELPTVVVFKNGQPVDGFSGSHDEAKVRELMQKHLPAPEDDLLAQAQQFLQSGKAPEAFSAAKQARDLNNKRSDIALTLAQAHIELGQLTEAEALLGGIPMVDQDHYYSELQAKLELAKKAADTPEIQSLQQQVAESPTDFELQVKLSVALDQANRKEEALEILFAVLKKDLAFGDAKKLYLDMLKVLPNDSELGNRYRNRFYTLMY